MKTPSMRRLAAELSGRNTKAATPSMKKLVSELSGEAVATPLSNKKTVPPTSERGNMNAYPTSTNSTPIGAVAGSGTGITAAVLYASTVSDNKEKEKIKSSLKQLGQQTSVVRKTDIDATLESVMGAGKVPSLSPQQYQEYAAMGNMRLLLS